MEKISKISNSVKPLKYMNECFSLTNDFELLESCHLYIIAKYKASNCCKKRNSHSEAFRKKGVLKNLAKFTGKTMCQSLFNKVSA